MTAKIYIDPGHGGDSIGATYKGRKEQDDCLRLSLAVEKYLLTQPGVEVKLSRRTDINPDLMARANEANAWGADYFLSIHRNAFVPEGATGAEIWVYSKVLTSGETYKFAEAILNDVCAVTGYKNRGVKLGATSYDDYAVNKYTNMHSALFEVGFIDNTKDNQTFDKCLDAMALSIAKNLIKAVGLTWTEANDKKADTTNDNTLYRVQIGAFKNKANAEAYAAKAKAEGFDAFVTVVGDVDGDGKITSADARTALRKSVGLE